MTQDDSHDPAARDAADTLDPNLFVRSFQHAELGTAIFDAQTHRIRCVNAAFARDRGYSPAEMRGLSVDALYPAGLVLERRTIRAAIDAGERTVVETEHVTRSGRRFPVELDCTVLRDASDRPESVIVYARDISSERSAARKQRLAVAAFEAAQPLMVLDAGRRIQRVNGAFTALTGYPPQDVLGQQFPFLRGNHDDGAYDERRWSVLDTTGFWQGEEWIRTKDGEARIVRRTLSAVRGADDRVTYYVSSLHDLTRERGALADLDHLTFSDRLTGLPNRDFLRGQLQHLLETSTADPGVLLVADIDQFKHINELHGHAAGDALLLQIARRLQQQESHALMCRLDGDTFAWLAPVVACGQCAPCNGVCPVAERLRAALREPFELNNGMQVRVTASIGWTRVALGENRPDATLEEAELALRAAKAAGSDCACGYTPNMQDQKQRRELLIRELQAALTGEGLALHPQLQVDRDGRAVGAEALLRWTRANGEQVEPEVFIPLAAQGRLLETLDMWVLDHACELLANWAHKPFLANLTLAANVSARRFQQPGFVDALRARLARTGADPTRLQLEITESAALGDFTAAAEKLRRLRSLGVKISLDDFGVGYSSMTYLAHLPLDQLKIDQSFVAQLPTHGVDTVLVKTIIAMAHGIGLEVVAEGVEADAQQSFLRAHGCDLFQGFLYAKSMPTEAFEAMVRAMRDDGQRRSAGRGNVLAAAGQAGPHA